MKCWNCGAEFEAEDLDVDSIPMTDSVTGEKLTTAAAPIAG